MFFSIFHCHRVITFDYFIQLFINDKIILFKNAFQVLQYLSWLVAR